MNKILRLFEKGDHSIFKLVNNKMSCGTFDRLMPYLTALGGLIFSMVVPIALILLNKDNSKLLGFEITIALIISTLIVQLLKKIFARERPYNKLEDIRNFNYDLKDYSFPSGHTTAAFAIVTIIIMNLPAFRLLILVGIGIGLSRIYLGVHFPTDVVIGGIIGFYTAIFTHTIVWPLIVLSL